ncbi:hypothetical protein NCS52_01112100 [Fusarium sp. LHS14.1]|nr:hypothetical protein NCS52_01112100 [Fusarium sp. LHS14.1]
MRKTRKGRGAGPGLSPELRMSGYAVMETKKVTLLPRIWILYDHQKWKKSIQAFVKELEWLECEGFGGIEIRKGCPMLAAMETFPLIDGLDLDESHAFRLKDDMALHLHVEQPQEPSACGLICCATLTKNGAVAGQRLSRIGGLISVNNKTSGITTAHGMLEWFWSPDFQDLGSDDEYSAIESVCPLLSSDDEESDSSSIPDPTAGFYGDHNETPEEQRWTEPLGKMDPHRILAWNRVQTVGLTSFLGTHAPDLNSLIQEIIWPSPSSKGHRGDQNTDGVMAHSILRFQYAGQTTELCEAAQNEVSVDDPADVTFLHAPSAGSDFSLWDIPDIEKLHNEFTASDLTTIKIDAVSPLNELSDGPVKLLLGTDLVLDGSLLPETMSFSVYGVQFETRKIRTSAPLARGCSGSWVVRGGQFCGVIIASYEDEPYVHMVTAHDLMLDIEASSPQITSVKLPSDKILVSTGPPEDIHRVRRVEFSPFPPPPPGLRSMASCSGIPQQMPVEFCTICGDKHLPRKCLEGHPIFDKISTDSEEEDPQQTRVQSALSEDHPDEGRRDENQRFKSRKKKARRRKHARYGQPKAREGAGSKSSVRNRKHDPTISCISCESKRTFWDLNFGPRWLVGWQYENKPFREVWKDSGSDLSLIRFFMTESGAANRLMPEVELAAGFCPDNTLNELESGSSRVPQANIALLDDRTNDGMNSISRGYLGPLNAHKLYLELKKERFHFEKDNSGGNNDSVTSQNQPQAHQLNADRRLLFITDLNRWSMMALISTASVLQARALRDSLYRYLAFRGFVGSVYLSSGISTFQLAFDLPSYAFRVTPGHSPPRDLRKRRSTENGALRKITDLSFLVRKPKSPAPPTTKAFLCEVQTTVLISGSDPWRWVAYCFVDTYFEGEDKRESVDAYDEVEIDDESHMCIQPDPFTTAESDANQPVLNPREYFLVVLESRLRHVRDEWHTLISNMGDSIHEYINTCPITMTDPPSPPPDDPLAVRQSRGWAVRTKKLLRPLIQKLTATINQLDSLKSDETFATLAGPAPRLISEIGNHTKRLRGSLEDLENLRKACDDYNDDTATQLSFYFNHEGTRDAKTQAQMASFSQNMTFLIVGLLSPIAVAAGVLSMHQQAIPAPLGPNTRSFFGLIIILMVAVWSTIGITHYWKRIWQRITEFFKPILADDIDLEGQQE